MAAPRKTGSRQRGISVEDVAREAGVSAITVSRALSHPEKVRPATRDRIAAAVEKTGYVFNNFASSLRSGRSSIISAFVSNLQNPHFAQAMQGCADALEGSRFHLLMAQTGYSDRLEQEMVDQMLPFRPAAALFTGIVQSAHTRAALCDLGIPVMEMWDFSADPIDMLVGFSNAEGGRLMGMHFGQRGFGKIAYAGRTEDRGAQRLAGFREGLKAFGLAPALVLPLEGSRVAADGEAAFETILERLPDCDAMFFATDLLAVGAALAARRLGVDIPGRVAIAGYGDLDICRQLYRPLTSIHVSGYEMGFDAGQMLRARLENRPIATRIILAPVRLEARESTERV